MGISDIKWESEDELRKYIEEHCPEMNNSPLNNRFNKHFVLKNKKPVLAKDWAEYLFFTETIDSRRIAETLLPSGVRISTVFLPLDHNFRSGGAPVLFETMIFGGPLDQYQDRYRTYRGAEIGHEKAVKLAIKEEIQNSN